MSRQNKIKASYKPNNYYETKISDARWWAYDLPGNIGWIVWFVCLVLCLKQGATAYSILSIVPAIFMLVGIVELISERIAKLDRVLPKSRLLRGFGALTLGGVLGVLVSLAGIVISIVNRTNIMLPIIMCIGGILCGLFAGLLYKGYRPKEDL